MGHSLKTLQTLTESHAPVCPPTFTAVVAHDPQEGGLQAPCAELCIAAIICALPTSLLFTLQHLLIITSSKKPPFPFHRLHHSPQHEGNLPAQRATARGMAVPPACCHMTLCIHVCPPTTQSSLRPWPCYPGCCIQGSGSTHGAAAGL